MTFKPYKCGVCGKSFVNEQAATDHAEDAHKTSRRVPIFKIVNVIKGDEREESFAERAIAASQSISMGEHTDDAWLLGDAEEPI